jgi:hypothetical protein
VKPPSLPSFFAAATPHRLAVLKALWPPVAGEAIANHSEVVGIQGDVMRVRADSAGWLKTIREIKGTLILRLQAAAGPLGPRAIAFIEGPVTVKPVRRRKAMPLQPVAVSELPSALREAASNLPTAEDREIYLRAVASFKARFPSRPPN